MSKYSSQYNLHLPNPFEFRPRSYISSSSASPNTECTETFLSRDNLKLPPLEPNSQYNMPLPSLAEALNGKPLKSKNGYAFISLFNEAIQKRPRRRYHEVERFYKCLHPNCDKSYGALNHLNAHIVAQSHGTKRRASEFKN